MPVKSPSKPGAIPVPKVLNLLEACRSCCHASAAAICQSLSKSSPAQAAIHFSTADASGWTPLLYAARNGWPDVVEHCLAGAQGSPHTARLQSSGNTGRCILCWQHSLHWDNSVDAARRPSIVHQLLWQLFDCRQGLGNHQLLQQAVLWTDCCVARCPCPELGYLSALAPIHPADRIKDTQDILQYMHPALWYSQDCCVHSSPCSPLPATPFPSLQRFT